MNYLAMPVGSSYGWGICGKYIARELNALAPGQLRLITPPFTPDMLGDELEFHALKSLEFPQLQLPPSGQLDSPLLIAIADKQLLPFFPLKGTRTVGYTFFEENIFAPAWIDNGRKFDTVATGSSWCTQVLREHGLAAVETVIQGVDPRIFFAPPESAPPAREFLRDRFVIFSGGKFELRKGQDVALRAVKILQDRHPDVFLITSWFNAWQESFDTMKASPHVRWPSVSGNYVDVMNQLLAFNGLHPSRFLNLGPRPNALMPRIYHNTDLGLFPNRCEGGTNLVLMEYMACGKPVVATATTGHADIVTPSNSLAISAPTELTLNNPQGPVARWPEPSLDDTVDKLEYAYQHRTELRALGTRAGHDMAQRTWTHTAARFHTLLNP